MMTEEQYPLLLAFLTNQMALMMGLAELMEGLHPWAQSSRTAAQKLRLLHEQTRQMVETLKP